MTLQGSTMDTIFYNGKVVCMDGRTAQAVCVEEGKIAFVGSDREALGRKTENAALIDLGGRLMLPGFIDTHMHLLFYGESLSIAKLAGARSKRELLELGRAFLKEHPDLALLAGAGWNNDYWEDDTSFPKRWELDEISREIPIAFTRACYHVVCLNSKALEVCGITKNTPDMPGGSISRGEDGEPDGVLCEDACALTARLSPELSVERAKAYIRSAAKDAASCGITTVHTDDFVFSAQGECAPLRAYEQLAREDSLPLRVYLQCRLGDLATLEGFFGQGYAFFQGDERLRVGPLKIMGDGSLGARTAYLSEPYRDAPETRGIPIYPQQELDALVCAAARRNMPSVVHAIGDAALDMVLNAFEKARALEREQPAGQDEKTPLRHGVVHCQITDAALLARMRALEVMALVQPIFLDYDLHIADSRVGERARTSYAFSTMRKLGIRTAFGSDAPVERFNVIRGIYHAVTRADLSGYPAGGWYPEEKLSVEEAVAGFTRDAAYASDEENSKGTIAPGKLADLVVLDADIFTVPAQEIQNASVVMTVCGGQIVFREGI